MLNHTKHRVTLIDILKSIYADPELRIVLGFKGGTAAMLFYDLPRLSVDLDFDLLDAEKKELVFKKMKALLERYGILREAKEKKYTLFFLISYEKGEHTIKVDISKRKGTGGFEAKSYLNVTALVMRKEDMVAGKLAALLTRKRFAMRDVFDVCFFLRNKWPVNEIVLTEKTGLSVRKGLEQAIRQVNELKKDQLLHGLGELLDAKQKAWVKTKLIEETVFYLRLYREIHGATLQAMERPAHDPADDIPVLDIDPGVGGAGGSKGHVVHFYAINTGEKVAIDVRWGLRGFAYEWRSPDTFVLRPGDRQRLEYKISDEKPFSEFVPELNIIFEYKDNRGVSYLTRRELVLEKVPSGLFYTITRVGMFHPAVVLENTKIRTIEKLSKTGSNEKALVKVEVGGQLKEIYISISDSLIGKFGFLKQEEINAALAEFAKLKVRNMLRAGKLYDHVFSREDIPNNSLSGFEAYKALRDSIDR